LITFVAAAAIEQPRFLHTQNQFFDGPAGALSLMTSEAAHVAHSALLLRRAHRTELNYFSACLLQNLPT